MADDSWERRHELAFALELHRAECEFLTGELAAAEERLTMLSSRAEDTVELATVKSLRVVLYTTKAKITRAIEKATERKIPVIIPCRGHGRTSDCHVLARGSVHDPRSERPRG